MANTTFRSLGGAVGYLPITAGSPINVATNVPADGKDNRVVCHTLFIQQVAANTGKLYLMDRSTGNATTGVGVLATIPAPTLSAGVAVLLPWAAVTIPFSPGGLNARDYYLDGDHTGDFANISAIVT